MGTVLHAAGYPLDRALPELNLSDPGLVRRIHDSYLAAGVGLVQTNTFGAGPLRLELHGLADRTEQVNAAGVRVAREAAAAAGRDGAGRRVGRAGGHRAAAAPGARGRPGGGAAGAGAGAGRRRRRLLVLETFGYLDELVEAAGVAADVAGPGGLAVLAQATFAADGRTLGGDSPHEVCAALRRAAGRRDRHQLHARAAGRARGACRQLRRAHRVAADRAAQRRAAPAQRSGDRAASPTGSTSSTSPATPSCWWRPGRGAGRRLLRHHPGAPGRGGASRAARPADRGPRPEPGPRPRSAARGRRRPAAAGFRVLAEIEPPQAGHVADGDGAAPSWPATAVCAALLIAAGGGPRAQLEPGEPGRAPAAAARRAGAGQRHHLGPDDHGAAGRPARRARARGAPDRLRDRQPAAARRLSERGRRVGRRLASAWSSCWPGSTTGRDCNGLRLAEKTAFEIGARVAAGARGTGRGVGAGAAQGGGRGPVPDHPPGVRPGLGAPAARDALGEPAPLLAAVRPLRSFAEADYLAHEVPGHRSARRRCWTCWPGPAETAAEAGVELAVELVHGLRVAGGRCGAGAARRSGRGRPAAGRRSRRVIIR